VNFWHVDSIFHEELGQCDISMLKVDAGACRLAELKKLFIAEWEVRQLIVV